LKTKTGDNVLSHPKESSSQVKREVEKFPAVMGSKTDIKRRKNRVQVLGKKDEATAWGGAGSDTSRQD